MPASVKRNTPEPNPLPAGRKSTAFQLSPDPLRRFHCSCTATSSDQTPIDAQLSRLEGVWQHTMSSTLPRQVREAGERICHHLRAGGSELAHLAARVLDVPDGGDRTEVSILWLAPASGETIGHRLMAEVLVHLFGRGGLENVAVRFAADWEDWTVAQRDEYFRVEGIESVKIVSPRPSLITNQMVLGKVWAEVRKLLQGECQPSASKLMPRIWRARVELARKGKTVTEFEVEMVYRKPTSGKHMYPVIRITMHLADGGPGAMVLIETGSEAGKRKAKNVAVVYQGEWPVAHHYRTIIGPPDLKELKGVVRDDSVAIEGNEQKANDEELSKMLDSA